MDYTILGSSPIEGDKPAGIDVRYEPAFETLQTEIDKLGSPTASGQVDWSGIVDTAAKILETQSKDLTVASYLAVGLVRTGGVTGLDQGLQVLKGLVETFWDQLYPAKKRMRGRLGAMTWWLEKTETELKKLEIKKPLPADLVQRILDNLKAMDDILVEKMPDPPLLRSVQRRVERFDVEQAAPAEAEAPPATAAPVQSSPEPASRPAVAQTAAPKPSPVAGTTETAESITNAREAGRAVDTALQKIRQASTVLLSVDLKKPLAYRLRRIAAWASIDTLPPNSDGATQIPPPPAQVLDTFGQLQEAGNTQAFIETAEQKLSQYIFWFDLNRMAAEGLSDLGADHGRAHEEVCRETAVFLQRLPGIEALCFSDGMPFADPQTRSWLKGLSPSGGNGGTVTSMASTANGDSPIRVQLQEATAMARKKQLAQGVKLLQDNMRRCDSRSMRMRWRLAIIQVLLSVKKAKAALPHAQQVLQEIDDFKLEAWDPDLALEALTFTWQAFNAQSADEFKTATARLVQRIAGIDPAAALNM
jgi:type VI secretion system protein VasJ